MPHTAAPSQTTASPDFDARYRAIMARDARFDGRFFTGVTSTGIYCRPICPARTPARRHVRFFDDAAAAEAAGFRPCKRCRPEASPGFPDGAARTDLVARALRLIEDGDADEEGVRGLARRLHVTERHLHRLFVAEVGAPPSAVARTRRLQLARRLLVETGMPVTDVAFASGFGSVRQFNDAVRQAYGQTPTELRDGSRSRVPGLELRLAYRPPFDAGSLLAFLRARAIPGVEEVGPRSYARTVPGGTITLTPAAGHVVLRVLVDDVRGAARLVARARRLFDLDAAPAAVAEALGADPALRPLLAARPGLRVPGAFDGFELAVRAVLGQQVSVAAASTLAGRLVARYGTRVTAPEEGGGGLTHLFPTAEQLAEADLSDLGMPATRRRTLRTLAVAVAGGELDLGSAADPSETVERLRALPGIGPWTAGYVAMRALRDPDAFPVGDLVLRQALDRLGIGGGGKLPDRWRPWRAYASMHLWASLSASRPPASRERKIRDQRRRDQ